MDLVDSRLQGHQLTVLRQDKLKEAVEKFVDKEEKSAIPDLVKKQIADE